MADLSSFGPKDQKILRENPGKTPYELAELGLTNKAFERLLAGEMPDLETKEEAPEPKSKAPTSTQQENITKPSSVRKVENKVQLTAPKDYIHQKVNLKGKQVQVLNKRTGKVVKLSAHAAQRLLKSPQFYQLV